VLALLGLAVPVLAFAAARKLQDVTIVQATGATCGFVGAPRVGRRAAYRLSGTVVTTTEPLASSAAIISPLSSAMPMWTSPSDLLPITSRSPGWIWAFGTAW